ncbi:MAG: DNA polymerase IV [Burkholderiaceae bacterium]
MTVWPKIIVHADMDAFYAAVEQRDNPDLRGKPILIGPNSHRGVVLTASYEARPFGVGSAMPVALARRRCPQAIMVPPRFDRYQAVSKQVMEVFAEFSPSVEALSLDEAFLDMSGATHFFGQPEQMGQQIKEAVKEATELTISVGVSASKYVAKVASAHDKPNGLTVVPPDEARAWLAPMPVSRLWGAGKKTVPKLQKLGLMTIGDVAAAGEYRMQRLMGSSGVHFYRLATAQDPRSVASSRRAKSIGSERTLSRDITQRSDIEHHLRRSAEKIARRVRAKQVQARGVRIRLKTHQFELISRQCQLQRPDDTASTYFTAAKKLLDRLDHPGPFRLVGMAVFDFHEARTDEQPDLFSNPRNRKLEATLDQLAAQFGKGVVSRATELGSNGIVADSEVNLDFLDHEATDLDTDTDDDTDYVDDIYDDLPGDPNDRL